jgi:hypothetical protein
MLLTLEREREREREREERRERRNESRIPEESQRECL